MAGSRKKLGAKKETAILELLRTPSIEEAARAASVPPRTLHRWLNDPEFDAAYRKARHIAFGQSGARLQRGTGAAVTTMLKIMLDAHVSPSIRLRAADCVFGHAKNAIEMEEIEARLSALEQAAESSRQSR